MSADNWTTCPRCAVIREQAIEAMDADLARAYGAVPIEDFDRMRASRDAKAAEDPEPTLREDYEFWGVSDSEFHVSYSGTCTACGFGHTFRHEEQLQIGDDR
jgi:hypothetical protein